MSIINTIICMNEFVHFIGSSTSASGQRRGSQGQISREMQFSNDWLSTAPRIRCLVEEQWEWGIPDRGKHSNHIFCTQFFNFEIGKFFNSHRKFLFQLKFLLKKAENESTWQDKTKAGFARLIAPSLCDTFIWKNVSRIFSNEFLFIFWF